MSKARAWAFVWILALFLAENFLQFLVPGLRAPLMLIGVVFYALYEGPQFGLWIGLAAGLLMDLYGTAKFGPEMAIHGALGVLCGYSASKLFRESLLTQMALPALATYLLYLANAVFFRSCAASESVTPGVFLDALAWPPILFAAAVSPIFFRHFRRISFVRSQRRLY